MVVLAFMLWRTLPRSRNTVPMRYVEILRSLLTLTARHPRRPGRVERVRACP